MTIACQQNYSLTVVGDPCPNWGDLVWTVGLTSGCGLINSFVGGNIHHRVENPCGAFGIIRERYGTMVYTGPGCNCQIQVDWDVTIAAEHNDTGIEVVQGVTMIAQFKWFHIPARPLIGSETVLFSLGPGVGADQNITVRGVNFGGLRYFTLLTSSGSTQHTERWITISNV